MANWNTPAITDTYVDVLDYLKNRDIDAATMFVSTPTNQPTGSIKYDRVNNKFQEWDGAAWQDKVLSIAAGGTGAATASAARTALGIGTLGTQNSNAVSISGGSIAGLTSLGVSGNVALGGILTLGSTPITINDAAGYILETAIADGNLLARNAGNETISGLWTFTGATLEFSRSGSNRLYLGNTSAATDNKLFNIRTSGTALEIQLVDDTKSVFSNVIGINRSGMSVGVVNLSGDWTFANSIYITGATYRATRVNITDAPLNQKIWDIAANTSQFVIATVTDAGVAGQDLINATRSGTTIGAVSTNGNWSFAGTVTVTGITTINNVLRVAGSAGLGSTESFSFASFASPNIGRIFIGDGTGYRMHISSRASSVTSDKFTFYDSGNLFLNIAQSVLKIGAGIDSFNSRLAISDGSSANAPAFVQSGEPGISAEYVILSNNYYGVNTGASSRINTSNGGSVIRLKRNGLGLCTVSSSGVLSENLSINSADITGYIPLTLYGADPILHWHESDSGTDGKWWRMRAGGANFYLETINDAYSASQNVFEVRRTSSSSYAVSQLLFDNLATFDYVDDVIRTRDLTPLADNSYSCGSLFGGNYRWTAVYAVNGTIQTSDITQKNIVDDVPGLEAVLNLDPFMFTWKNDKDGKKFAGVSAQDVAKYLGEDFVTIDRFGIYHMNYSNLIPVLIKAIQELYRRK